MIRMKHEENYREKDIFFPKKRKKTISRIDGRSVEPKLKKFRSIYVQIATSRTKNPPGAAP